MTAIRALVLAAVVLAGCGGCVSAFDSPIAPNSRALSLIEQEQATVEVIACDAAGTGVIVSRRHVVTAFHVVAGCGVVIIKLHDGTMRVATLEVAHVSDLARLRILDEDIPDVRPYTGTAGMGNVVCHTAAHPTKVRECGVVRLFKRDRRESGDARYGARVVKGNSGAPVWRDGLLVGIVVQCDLADDSTEEKPKCAERGGGYTAIDGARWLVENVDLR